MFTFTVVKTDSKSEHFTEKKDVPFFLAQTVLNFQNKDMREIKNK